MIWKHGARARPLLIRRRSFSALKRRRRLLRGPECRQAARRSYRWCKPPTSGNAITSPSVMSCTRRGVGASFANERCVRVPMIIDSVRRQDAPQMPLTEHDDVVETLPADGTDHALGVWILPRARRTRNDFVDAHAGHSASKFVTVDGIAISHHPSRRRVIRKRFDHCCAVQLRWDAPSR